MTVLVTGAAGFIGMHVAARLLDRGDAVIGIDNLNDYYDVALKQSRLDQLTGQPGFTFAKVDIADKAALTEAIKGAGPIDGIVHLAAQAGVRYSLTNPDAYIQANIVGQLNILELARHTDGLKHLVYASSSSVYGGNRKHPFSVEDRVDHPISLYAATKKADELMGHAYSHLYGIPMTGLRFFTVYGPWGRPDMSVFIFTRKILAGDPIPVFNHGKMRRDFTYIDDIVSGVVSALDRPPSVGPEGEAPQRVYNIGNNSPVGLMEMIETLQDALGVKAVLDLQPMQPGDVPETYADIDATTRDLGFRPTTSLEVGLRNFVNWYRGHYG